MKDAKPNNIFNFHLDKLQIEYKTLLLTCILWNG